MEERGTDRFNGRGLLACPRCWAMPNALRVKRRLHFGQYLLRWSQRDTEGVVGVVTAATERATMRQICLSLESEARRGHKEKEVQF